MGAKTIQPRRDDADPPYGGGIYIIAHHSPTEKDKPIVPVYAGETENFRGRWKDRLELFEDLFGKNAAPVLKGAPYNSFAVYIGRFPVEDAPKGRSELTKYRKDVEWVLIRYLTKIKRYPLNQSRKVGGAILSAGQGIKITNNGATPPFLDPIIEVAPGDMLELSVADLK